MSAKRDKSYLNVFVTRLYKDQGSDEERTNYIKVGAAFPNTKGGFAIEIEEGISVSGKLVAFPPRENGDSK